MNRTLGSGEWVGVYRTGRMLDCWLTGRAINLAPGACFITKFITLHIHYIDWPQLEGWQYNKRNFTLLLHQPRLSPAKYSLTEQNLKHQTFHLQPELTQEKPLIQRHLLWQVDCFAVTTQQFSALDSQMTQLCKCSMWGIIISIHRVHWWLSGGLYKTHVTMAVTQVQVQSRLC